MLVGGARLGWPDGVAEDDVPPWLVFSAMIRSVAARGAEPGLRPLFGALDEVGFTDIDAGEIVAGFASHLMHGFHEWREAGFDGVAQRFLDRLSSQGGRPARLAGNGDLVLVPAAGTEAAERLSLKDALARPTWLDPATREPWL